MAKKFAGFTTEQQKKLLGSLGYTGPAQQDDINKFVMSNPKAASMLSRSADMAKARIAVADRGFQAGGFSTSTTSPGVGKVLMEKYGYTLQDGMYVAPTPAATPTPAPAAVSTPTTPAAVTPTPTPAVEPTPAPAVTPTPTPPAEPTGTNKILVEKYGWEYDPTTGKANKPGVAPQAPAAVPTPTPVVEPTPPAAVQPTPTPVVEPTPAPSAPTPAEQPPSEVEAVSAATNIDTNTINAFLNQGYEIENGQLVKTNESGIKYSYAKDSETGKFVVTRVQPTAPEVTPEPVAAEEPVAGEEFELPKINDKTVLNTAPTIDSEGNIVPGTVTVTYSDGTVESVTSQSAIDAGIDIEAINTIYAKQVADQKILNNIQTYGLVSLKRTRSGTTILVDQNGNRIPDSPETSEQGVEKWVAENGFSFLGGSGEASKLVPDAPVETPLISTESGAQFSSVFNPETKSTTYKVVSPTGSVQTFNDYAAAQDALGVFQKQDFDLPGAEGVTIKVPGLEGTEGEYTTEGIRYKSFADPGSIVRQADAATIAQTEAQKLADEAGAAEAVAEQAVAEKAAAPTDVAIPTAPDITEAAVTATQADVQETVDTLVAATGKPSAEAIAEAATMSPEQLAQLGLNAAQIEQAAQVQAVTRRAPMPGEMIEGPTVEMARVEQAVNFEAATGAPSTDATVQGQLTQLMADFEGGEPPAWAAGAMRTAAATMAARGLGSSSLAGQAIVQAAMESALPIAMQDAQTVASFEAQNLSNRQQTAMFAAEQRAKFLGMEFDQAFQTRVQNAAKIADIANMNFTAEQQVALENARITSTTDIANLNASNAKVLADAAAMSQIDTTNLSNIMKANVQKADAFLQTDMASLSNEQQTTVFKAQALINSILNDASANNAASQFNAASQNQLDQFVMNITSDIDRFNSEQQNAINMFNAGEANAIDQFNTAQQNARDQFNAQNALIVAQANAAWQQAIATADTAAQNQAIRDGILAQNNLTMQAYANMIQMERDMLDYAWRTADNALARENALLQVEMNNNAQAANVKGQAVGTIAATASKFFLSKILDIPIV